MMGYGKNEVSGALHNFGLPGNSIAADLQTSNTTLTEVVHLYNK
jgi:hypothetical protein